MTDRRYPVEPLAEKMHRGIHAALAQLGVSGTTQQEYRARGVTHRVADRLATKAGYHPHDVWPEMREHDLAAASKACVECGTPFVPVRSDRQFCTNRCYKRRWQRERYQTDPDWRARQREHKRRHDAETAEYRRRVEQRRYWSDPERYRAKARDRYRQNPAAERERSRRNRQRQSEAA